MGTEREAVVTLTVRELVKVQRTAFLRGWREWQSFEHDDDDCHQAVARIFPLPKITRPRIVRDGNDGEWRFTPGPGGGFSHRALGDTRWTVANSVHGWMLNEHLVKMWADLLANPNEEVEDDA